MLKRKDTPLVFFSRHESSYLRKSKCIACQKTNFNVNNEVALLVVMRKYSSLHCLPQISCWE